MSPHSRHSRKLDYPLGAWVGTQRAWHANGKLDPDRQRRLQELPGWTWKASSST
ncbi:helicase associated domain-containing protein [Mycobacterium sp. 1164985.4]|uniref:helicase associated domain-containing protein n=1 Tax=Mycobacterium sp. 1164985.4 TaxID=1834069 RepID=UPI000B2BFC58|nr:helicase associated domain-containing protein [Mycobacterium sp. 1164985.4]